MILTAAAFLSSGRDAAALTADDVLNRMNADQRFGYISGVVEGLAFSRWLEDQPDSAGMNCIYDWYYQGDAERSNQIDGWLNRHLDRPVGALMHVLIRQECGD